MKKQLIAGAALSLLPIAAYAHSGHDIMGFWAGFMHPITGFDHLLVMLAVGFWAAQSTIHSAAIKIGSLFVSMLLAGVAISSFFDASTMFESAIAMSLIVMALLVLLSARVKLSWQVATISAFAVLHGVVHGQELLIGNTAVLSVLGMSLATTVLLLMGYAIGRYSNQLQTVANNIVASLLTIGGLVFLFS